MNQLIWRLHRNQAFFAGAALAVLAAILVVTGRVMAGDYRGALATCGSVHTCGSLTSFLYRGDGAILDVVSATIAIPLLFGLFWGAPMVAKELEDGTHNLVWTQSVPRRRWMASNLAVALLSAALWGMAMALLVSWWRAPENALYGSRFSSAFDITGIVPVAYALFAVALGIAAGTVLRRVLPAVATTLAGFVLIRAGFLLWVRPHLLAPIRQVVAVGQGPPFSAWLLNDQFINAGGRVVALQSSLASVPAQCQQAFFAPSRQAFTGCLSEHGFHSLLTYQPASRYWSFQAMEAGIFVALAAGLVVLAYQVVRRRDA